MASQEPIFRSIQVAEGQSITLGEPIPADVEPLMRPAGPNRKAMNPGTFHGADTITVLLAGDEIVTEMDFDYGTDPSYGQLLVEYEAMFGRPASGPGQSAIWEDSGTRFEVFLRGGNAGSLLTDLLAE
jgi:hypothetical protein